MRRQGAQNPNPILFHESSTSWTNFTKFGSSKQSQIISSIAAILSSFDCAAYRARVSPAVAGADAGGLGAGNVWWYSRTHVSRRDMNSAGSTWSSKGWRRFIFLGRLDGSAWSELVVPKLSAAERLGEERLIGLTTLRLDGAASGVAGTQMVSELIGVSLRRGGLIVVFCSVVFRPRTLLGATAFLTGGAVARVFLFLVAVTVGGESIVAAWLGDAMACAFLFLVAVIAAGESTVGAWLKGAVTVSGSDGGTFVFFDGKGSVRVGGSIWLWLIIGSSERSEYTSETLLGGLGSHGSNCNIWCEGPRLVLDGILDVAVCGIGRGWCIIWDSCECDGDGTENWGCEYNG